MNFINIIKSGWFVLALTFQIPAITSSDYLANEETSNLWGNIINGEHILIDDLSFIYKDDKYLVEMTQFNLSHQQIEQLNGKLVSEFNFSNYSPILIQNLEPLYNRQLPYKGEFLSDFVDKVLNLIRYHLDIYYKSRAAVIFLSTIQKDLQFNNKQNMLTLSIQHRYTSIYLDYTYGFFSKVKPYINVILDTIEKSDIHKSFLKVLCNNYKNVLGDIFTKDKQTITFGAGKVYTVRTNIIKDPNLLLKAHSLHIFSLIFLLFQIKTTNRKIYKFQAFEWLVLYKDGRRKEIIKHFAFKLRSLFKYTLTKIAEDFSLNDITNGIVVLAHRLEDALLVFHKEMENK